MSLPRILVLLVALTLTLLAFKNFRSSEHPEPAAVPEAPPGASARAENQQNAVGPDPQQEAEATRPTPVDEPACLTLTEFAQRPEVIQDLARMDQVSVSGTPMSAYESLGEDTIQGFADQGDAAAMAAIGAIHVMRAYGLDETLALRWLNNEQAISDLDLGNSQLSSAASLSLNEAAYWFYEAAIHGRILALQNYGQVRGRLFGGPVGLGWVDQEAYDSLDESEKASLMPANLYAQLAYDIAPALRDGAPGVLSGRIPESAMQQSIRDELVSDFQQALADRGLSSVEVSGVASPDVEDLISQLCSFETDED